MARLVCFELSWYIVVGLPIIYFQAWPNHVFVIGGRAYAWFGWVYDALILVAIKRPEHETAIGLFNNCSPKHWICTILLPSTSCGALKQI